MIIKSISYKGVRILINKKNKVFLCLETQKRDQNRFALLVFIQNCLHGLEVN